MLIDRFGVAIVHLRVRGGGQENLLYTQRGGKTLIYAAYADDYDELVTYTPNPNCETSNDMGNRFEISHLLTHINVNNPQRVSRRMLDFTQAFGNDWYFCKREAYDIMSLINLR